MAGAHPSPFDVGQCKTTKPTLVEVWKAMEWHYTDDGLKVGLLKHFLKELQLAKNNPGQRAETFNAMLRERGYAGRVLEKRLRNKCGRKPWVATQDTLRNVYQLL